MTNAAATAARRLAGLPLWVAPAAIAVAGASACTVVALVDPGVPGRYPTCPFLTVTGRFCPGCGSLRAIHQLLGGNPATAFGYNPFLLLALPFLLWTFIRFTTARLGWRPPPAVPFPAWSVTALPFAVGAFWLARNLPVAPFDALAP